MAGVWDALGRGIESGVSAFLQGQEQQLRRRREEEEKAQRDKEWLLSKAQAQAGMEQADWARQQTEQKTGEAKYASWFAEPNPAQGIEGVPNYRELSPGAYIPIPLAEKQAMLKSQMEGAREWERKTRLEEIAATGAVAGQKEKAKDLYSPKGFNGEVALWLAMGNLGIQTDLELDQLLNGPQGQAMATSLVNRLVSVHGERWPGRNLAGDFWQFLKARNPKLQSPADVMASEAAQAQARAQQETARTAQQAEQARLAPIAAVQTQQAAQRGLAAGGVPVPIAAGMPAAMQANVQPFTQDDLAKLRMYDEAPEMTKPMMKNVEPFRSLLMRRGR